MKLVKILILIAVVVSFVPLDAFCDDHHDAAEHHHGIVLCNVSCHAAVLTASVPADLPAASSLFKLSFEFTYADPVLSAEVKPPISLS